jgi:Flp pilus assembly pilin Flp
LQTYIPFAILLQHVIEFRCLESGGRGRLEILKGKEDRIMKAILAIKAKRLNNAVGERGTTLVEYALVLLLVAFVLVLIVTSLGGTTNNTYCKINSGIFKSSP